MRRSNVNGEREFYFLVAFCFFFDAAASFLSRLISCEASGAARGRTTTR